MEHSPMLLDIIKGRETEVEYLNGYIRQLGQAYHVPTPHSNTLYDLVKLKEKVTPTTLE
jgi:2-dehydropantoate 2-reductase